ncbi:MAG: hypothetical protein IKN75_01555 [Prevotella sp.]|nr:hypothetical protein [Prevotella sp.]
MTRRYSEKEKKLIEILCKKFDTTESVSYYGMEPMYKLFEGTDYTLDKIEDINGTVYYSCCLNASAPKPEKDWYINILHEIYDAAILLKELEEDRLVYFLMLEEHTPIRLIQIRMITSDNNTSKEENALEEVLPPVISDILTKDVYGKFKVSQTLKDLYKNAFKTPEDLALEKAAEQTELAYNALKEARVQTLKAEDTLGKAITQAKYALWTFIISLVSLFITLCSQYFQ